MRCPATGEDRSRDERKRCQEPRVLGPEYLEVESILWILENHKNER